MTISIDGKLVSQKVLASVQKGVLDFQKKTGTTPGLATILVGDDPASHVYVKHKIKACEQCGIKSYHTPLSSKFSQKELIALIQQMNHDPLVHGILVQMPLPSHLDAQEILRTIDPKKDVDAFHPLNSGLLFSGQPYLLPCTPAGVMELLYHYQIPLTGKRAVVVGRSNIVGKPLAMLLLQEHATVTIAHSKTVNLPDEIKNADILVAAIGKPGFIKGEWVKPGAVVIDVGVNRLDNGKLCGDVEFEPAKERASFITPVPGGVGPMTIAMLMKNTLKSAQIRQ